MTEVRMRWKLCGLGGGEVRSLYLCALSDDATRRDAVHKDTLAPEFQRHALRHNVKLMLIQCFKINLIHG